MHRLCLAVTKKLLSLWLGNPLHVRLGSADRRQLSKLNFPLVTEVSKDFVRKPRSTTEVDRWKAMGFRLLLPYTAPAVLKSVLHPGLYINFLTLHCATFLVSSPSLSHQYVYHAEPLHHHFVRTFAKLYGDEKVSYNVHCVSHLAPDVQNQGPLHVFSTFPFENNLQRLKGLPQSHAQLYNHLKEQGGQVDVARMSLDSVQLTNKHAGGPIPPAYKPPQYKRANFSDFVFIADTANNCCMIEDSIIPVDNFGHLSCTQAPFIIGQEFRINEKFL